VSQGAAASGCGWQYNIMLLLTACRLRARLIEPLVTQTPIPTRSLASAAANLSHLRDVGERGGGEAGDNSVRLLDYSDHLSAE